MALDTYSGWSSRFLKSSGAPGTRIPVNKCGLNCDMVKAIPFRNPSEFKTRLSTGRLF